MLEYLTVKECAEFLRVSIPLIYKLIQEKNFPHTKIGKRVIVAKSELEKYLQGKSA
ncbi:MAG: helix-turn-helix domain-containing protein [Spirochaetes bacterium]|nr:helix-turn-helix domain-containing protein [Spirochaetota bacterium]